MRVECRKQRFPLEIKVLSYFRVGRVIIIDISPSRYLLEDRVVDALSDQEIHRFLELADDVFHLVVLEAGEFHGRYLGGFNRLDHHVFNDLLVYKCS